MERQTWIMGFRGSHCESTETISQGRRIRQDWKRREKLYSTGRRRMEGEKDLGPFILNKHPGRDEKSPGGTERESDQRRLGSAFCSELRGSPLQAPRHSRVKMVVVGFLQQGALDCPPFPLGLCVACRGNRSSPRGGQDCELSSKLRRGLAVEGWRVELTPQITGVEALGVYMVSKVSWGDQGASKS